MENAWIPGVLSCWENDEENLRPMVYQPADEGMNEKQKEEQKLAKVEREQMKKDRDAQRAKVRKDQLPAK